MKNLVIEKCWHLKVLILEQYCYLKVVILETYWYWKNIDAFDTRKVSILSYLKNTDTRKILIILESTGH